VLRKSSFSLLREQEAAVGQHVELALRALDGGRLDARSQRDLGRETRGPAVVASSDGAVVDLDGHGPKAIRAAPSEA
jgi:hypothetical protein